MTCRIPVAPFVLLVLLALPGCQSTVQPPASPTSAPAAPASNSASSQKRFDYPQGGISLSYPADWKLVPSGKSQLQISPPDAGKATGKLTLDVPTLPFHLPGMIPIDAVRDGYVSDAKKKIPDAAVTNLPDPSLPDAKQHWVKLVGHQDGKPAVNEGVLIVHNDKVYVLSIETDDKGADLLHSTLESVVKSVQWTK